MALFPLVGMTGTLEIKSLSFFTINSAITPATLEYLSSQTRNIPDDSLIVIKMNTPGGLVSTTKDIITLIGKQDHPVAVWITPEGASAASAGSIIASAAHFIFMSPGTSMGAATPVGLGEDLKESDGRKKAMNDLKSLVRSLSQERGRPAAPFEDMIDNATSFTDKEALHLKIAETLNSASKIPELLNNRTFKIKGQETTLSFAHNVSDKHIDPSLGQKLFEVLAHPTTAYFLFLLAVALIYFEFQAPGGYVAGTVGTCLLVIAGMGFQVLPLDWGAFSLLIIGVILLIIEIYVTTYGLLFLSGLAFFVIGSLFLFEDPSGFISVRYSVMYSSLAGVFSSMGLVAWYLWKEKKKKVIHPSPLIAINSPGVVMGKSKTHFQIKVRGEIWNATSADHLETGDPISVISVDPVKLLLEVKKLPSH